MARKDRVPNPTEAVAGPAASLDAVGSGELRTQQRRMLYLVGGSGVAVLVAILAIVFLTGGGGSDDERAALEAAGFTLQSFPALPNKSDHSDVPTLDDEAEVELVAADERAPLRRAGGLGLLRRGGAARADGAQPRARRRRHPLRPAVPEGRCGEDPRVVRPTTRTA